MMHVKRMLVTVLRTMVLVSIGIADSPLILRADYTIHVNVNTSAWQGMKGYLALGLTTGTLDSPNLFYIQQYTHNGSSINARFRTTGGNVQGDMILLSNPAVNTVVESDDYFTDQNGFPQDNRIYNLTEAAPGFGGTISGFGFGTFIGFNLDIPNGYGANGRFRDQITCYFLGEDGIPPFTTSDPFGTNALFAFTAPTSSSQGPWTLECFSPAQFVDAPGSVIDTINVILPAPPPPPPIPISQLSIPLVGRTTVSLEWPEPTQTGAPADHGEVRGSMNSINDDNWDDPSVAHIGSFIPHGGQECCFDVGNLLPSHMYYFAIKTQRAGLWSTVSNCPSAGTLSSGTNVYCDDGGGLVIVGSENWPSSRVLATEGFIDRPMADALGEESENSLLCGFESSVSDLCKVPGQTLGSDGSYRIRVRDAGFHSASVDQLSLGSVDHDPNTVAIAGPDEVYVGTLGPVLSVTDISGKETASLPVDSTSTFDAEAAQYLLVDLGDPAIGSALVIESSGGVVGAYADSVGILVQKPVKGGGWTTIARIHPRKKFDQTVVDSQGNEKLRVVFLRNYELKSLQRMTIGSSVGPQSMVLLSADQSKIGSVKDAVSASGGTATAISPGDTLNLTFSATPVPEGMVRDVFLTAKGSYSIATGTAALNDLASGSVAAAPIYQFALGAAHPNPSSGTVAFSFTMAKSGPASIRVYDVAGRLVRTLVNGQSEPGPHDIVWNASDDGGRRVGAGVYFYRMDAGSWRSQRKVVFLER